MAYIFGVLIVRPFGLILMAIYNLVQSYGLAVILFALLAQIILLPLGYKSKKGMRKMTAVQGRMQELQKKYANNKVKLNEEMQKLYEKEHINPMSGCLPTAIQFPILMGLYYAVQKPLTFMMGLGETDIGTLAAKVGVEITAQNSNTFQLVVSQALNQFVDAGGHFASEITNLSADIANYLVPLNFNFLGLDLSVTPDFKAPGIIWIIPVLSGVTAFLSSWLMQKMQGNTVQGQMKTMMYLMPLMSVYFGFIFPASIGIYWITRNVLMMAQEAGLTWLLNKRHPIITPEQERAMEAEERRRKHEEHMKRIQEEKETGVAMLNGKPVKAKPNPNTSRKKLEKDKKKGD
ncbi:YidC/Oxa1 family membrane protein insertase [Intestinibacillus massiliensis]|nr:YidC/Oxa1 family membrane protein insertase [Intestinibacillus massiliensis]